jgi:hypothetical protein
VEQWPYRSGFRTLFHDVEAGQIQVTDFIERQTNRGAHFTALYPLSSARRLEFSGGARALSFNRDVRTRIFSAETEALVDRQERRDTLAPTLYLGEASVAAVHDTSFYGAISPIYGSRARFQVGHNRGSIEYTSALADWRRYFMPVRPVTIAVRGLHFGRYGPNAERPADCLRFDIEIERPPACINGLADLYLGYADLVHGYGFETFSPADCLRSGTGADCESFNQLVGSRILVANIEVRAPLLGLFTGELEYGRVPIEVAAFVDAGVAWTSRDAPAFAGGSRRVVRSVGGAARVNVFGLLTLEVAASRPLDRLVRDLRWQIGIRQGF